MQKNNKQIPEDLLYNRDNYWIKVNEDKVLIGLTEYGQSTIGDILYLEIASAGTNVRREEDAGSIEAGKWVGRLLSPLSGLIEETNSAVQTNPRELNNDPYGQWLFRIKLNDRSELGLLMDAAAYAEWVEEQVCREREEEELAL